MKTKKTTVHRGEALQAAISNSDLTIKQITTRARFSRSSYYNHIADPNLPFEVLIKYGKVIKHDFTQEIPGMEKYQFSDEITPRPQPKTFDEAIADRDYWRDKYIALLERYNNVIEQKI